jgi:branched-chain amino acid transport system substrate-binding protein
VAILGEVASSRSLEAAPICQKDGVPQILAVFHKPEGHLIPGITIFPRLLYRSFQGTVMANFASEDAESAEDRVFHRT